MKWFCVSGHTAHPTRQIVNRVEISVKHMDRKTNKRELITPEMKSNTICLEIRIPPEGKHFPQFEKKEIASWEIKLDKTSSKQRSFSIKLFL